MDLTPPTYTELKEPGPQVSQQGEKRHPVVRPDQGAERAGKATAAREGDQGGGEAQIHVRAVPSLKKHNNAEVPQGEIEGTNTIPPACSDRDNRTERERIRLFREREKRDHLIRKRHWLEVLTHRHVSDVQSVMELKPSAFR